MRSPNLRVRVAKAVLAVACAVSAAAAQAVIYISNFDPIDFFGVATFDVDPGCLLVDGLRANDGVTCTVDWLAATVTLQNPPAADTLTFDYSAFLPSTTAVLAIDVLAGDLSGVHSVAIGPVVIAGNPVAEFNGAFSLMFDGDVVLLLRDGSLVATAEAQFSRLREPAAPALALLALAACWIARRPRLGAA